MWVLFWATFGHIWAIFYSNIWSHWQRGNLPWPQSMRQSILLPFVHEWDYKVTFFRCHENTRGLCILSLLLLLLLLSNDIKMMTEKKLKGLWLYFLEGKNFFAYYQCDQIWRNFNSIWTIFCMVHFIFGKLLKPTLTFLCYWANYHCCKWPNNNIAIWSHCLLFTSV